MSIKINDYYLETYANNSVLRLFFPGMPSVGESGPAPDDYYSSDDHYAGDDDDYLSSEEKVVHTTPTFVSTSTSQLVNEGDTIKLPCFVDKLGKTELLSYIPK